jgi:hypothetical protein
MHSPSKAKPGNPMGRLPVASTHCSNSTVSTPFPLALVGDVGLLRAGELRAPPDQVHTRPLTQALDACGESADEMALPGDQPLHVDRGVGVDAYVFGAAGAVCHVRRGDERL